MHLNRCVLSTKKVNVVYFFLLLHIFLCMICEFFIRDNDALFTIHQTVASSFLVFKSGKRIMYLSPWREVKLMGSILVG